MFLFVRRVLCTLILASPLWVNSSASASLIYGTSATLSGQRDTAAGELTSADSDWSDGILNWEITQIDGGLFHYVYTFLNFKKPGISHFTLDITDDAFNGKTLVDFGAITDATLNGETGITVQLKGPGTPGSDGITGAVKFDVGAEGTNVYAFNSNRAPVWGDFYLKGGQTYSTNLAFGNKNSMNSLDYIARPNGFSLSPIMTSSAPEPSSMLLGFLLVFGALAHSRIRSQRQQSQNSPRLHT